MPAKNSEFIPRFVHDRKQPKFLGFVFFLTEIQCELCHILWEHMFNKSLFMTEVRTAFLSQNKET